MTRKRLVVLAVLIPLVLLTFWRWVRPGEPGPDQSGVVKIVHNSPSRSTLARPIAGSETLRLPLVSNDENVALADEQSYHLAREARDRTWAERSEAALDRMMRTIPYVGGQRRLEIKCAATICEVSGIADVDPATRSFRPVWQALERDTAGEELGKVGLQRSTAIFDTGRGPDEFRIQFRRIDPVAVW